MRETKFINENKDKWSKFEKILNENVKDPEDLSSLFMEVTDDLSYSRTFYPNRSVRVYLNGLAQKIFYSIYRNRKSRLKKIWQFWRDDVPQILFESRFDFKLSFLVFMLSIAIGVFSSIMDPDFCRTVLGDSYVDMTIENIENGNPMSVYQDPDGTSMFLNITINNLRVAFLTFVLGLLFGGGTIYILIVNGIMVGTFQYLFFQHGVYADSLLTIWLHGAIEISGIVVAGAAGIHLGRGLLFPGTFTRLQGLQLSARRALLIFVTLIPLIILAGFIESFITRYSDASYFVRALFIIVSFAFMIGYYVVYPWLKARRGFTSSLREVNISAIKEKEIDFKSIKNSGVIFSDTFNFFRNKFKIIFSLAAVISLLYCTLQAIFSNEFKIEYYPSSIDFEEFLVSIVTSAIGFLFTEKLGLLWVLNVIGMSVMAYFSLHVLQSKDSRHRKSLTFYLNRIFSTLVICGIINIFMLIDMNGFLRFMSFIFIFPILMLWLSIIFNESLNIFDAFGKTFKLLSAGWSVMMGCYLVMLLISIIFMFLSSAPIITLVQSILTTILPIVSDDFQQFSSMFILFIKSFILCIVYPLLFMSAGIGQFSYRETLEATELFERIEKVGQSKRSYGLIKEDNIE